MFGRYYFSNIFIIFVIQNLIRTKTMKFGFCLSRLSNDVSPLMCIVSSVRIRLCSITVYLFSFIPPEWPIWKADIYIRLLWQLTQKLHICLYP